MLKIAVLFAVLFSGLADAEGQCTEADKAEHLFWENHKFIEVWETCGFHHLGRVQGTAKCLVKTYETLTQECATCFGEYASCLRSNCVFACATSRGDNCEKCAIDNCRMPIETCTGLPYWKLPSR